MKTCTHCGSNNKDINNFCTSCGKKLEAIYTTAKEQPTNSQVNYNIVFRRPSKLQMGGNVFHIKVDGLNSYSLNNGSEIKIPLTSGLHNAEISVFGVPKKKRISFQVSGDMTFVCVPNSLAGISPLLATPVKVTDINGREY